MTQNQVCLFFYVNGQFLVHGCELKEAEEYGGFLIYPGGHYEIWEKHYAKKYMVDYDFFPRGRVAYQKSTQSFQILYDRCIEQEVRAFAAENYQGKTVFGYDEHYQCSRCNQFYENVFCREGTDI